MLICSCMKNFAKKKPKTFGRREAVNAYNSASHFIGTHVNQSESLHSVSSVRLMTMNLFLFLFQPVILTLAAAQTVIGCWITWKSTPPW